LTNLPGQRRRIERRGNLIGLCGHGQSS
jgi:hypothetical protein